MPTIHMVHGFVGAGKTTFSRNLEKEIKAVRFSPDEWITDLYGDTHGDARLHEYEKRIKAVIWRIAESTLASGGDVILDFGFWKYAEREQVRQRAKNLKVIVKLYILQCPEDVMRARVLKRTAEMPDGALFIDENAFNEFKQYFEPVKTELEESLLIRTG